MDWARNYLRTNRTAKGLSLLELLMVMAVILFLASAIFFGTRHFRETTRRTRTQLLLEKVASGLETYKNHFRVYPPTTANGLSPNETLVYYLSSSFSTKPTTGRNEIQATLDLEACVKFEPAELVNGKLIDGWGSPLSYERILQTDQGKTMKLDVPPAYDPIRSMSAGSRQQVNAYIYKLYSFGPNKTDDVGGGDDLLANP